MGFFAEQVRPRLLDATMRTPAMLAARARACSGLSGDVLEIGYGSGLNHGHLPSAVRGVWAVEPSSTALRIAAGRTAGSGVPVILAGDDAQSLDLPDARFDAALSTWTLCGIPDPVRALREVARVLRPGAALHFVEHGLAPEESVARWQRRGNRFNRNLGGCLLDRDIPALVRAAGFPVVEVRTHYLPGAPRAVGCTYEGRARTAGPA
ncbi:methyltransferase family protein [Kineococcus xinjiangensis]|uniref:Methyltransferase family protein n=1 Tax=Kineococcus xinjiangensis TaxID=512762 RepID=A0A2S6IFZ8_9ACTN|nr:class I SAM-dependent methyltransferase [Kineococcus xinjiangensis]PPK93144.1 methyltransferase family protein [Kineococcus xinjiangensis]